MAAAALLTQAERSASDECRGRLLPALSQSPPADRVEKILAHLRGRFGQAEGVERRVAERVHNAVHRRVERPEVLAGWVHIADTQEKRNAALRYLAQGELRRPLLVRLRLSRARWTWLNQLTREQMQAAGLNDLEQAQLAAATSPPTAPVPRLSPPAARRPPGVGTDRRVVGGEPGRGIEGLLPTAASTPAVVAPRSPPPAHSEMRPSAKSG